MGYTFICNVCEDGYDYAPPYIGEFVETFIKTSPSTLTQRFRPGETVTICRGCAEVLFLSGEMAVCQRCGFATEATELPEGGSEECPRCEESDTLVFKRSGSAEDSDSDG